MISPVLVESLQRKYISGVGGFYYTHVTPPVSRKKRKKKKERKILSGNTDLELRDKSEYRGKFKAIFLHKNIFCDPSLEPSRWEGSYEGPQRMKNRGGRVVQWCWVKLPVPGHHLYYRRTRASCTCSRCGWRLFGHFYSHLSFLLLSSLSPSLWETARYRLKYCLKGPLNSKQPTNQRMKKYVVTLH